MKKYIQYFTVVLLLTLLSACGSNSKTDPSGTSPTSTTSGGLVTGDPTTGGGSGDIVDSSDYTLINVTTPVEINESSTAYTLQAQLIQNLYPVLGKTFNLQAFNDQYGTVSSMSATTDGQGYFSFQFTSIDNLSAVDGSSLRLTAVMEADDNGTTELSQEFLLVFNYVEDIDDNTTDVPDDNTTDVPDDNTTEPIVYVLKNATTSPIEIVEASTQYQFKVQLVVDGFAVAGETFTLKAFTNPNDMYGGVASMSATTDALGYATFTYTSPEDMDAVDGSQLVLSAVLEADPTKIQTFTLSFNKTEAVVVSELPFVVIPNSSKEITLTSNAQQEVINVNVFAGESNAPYSEGNVKVVLPAKIVDGVDVGSFESYTVPITNGLATFNYTGPQNLQDLIASGDTGSTFKFYHEDDPTNKVEMSVTYSVTSDDYIPANYTLTVSSQDNEFSMGIPDQEKSFSIVLEDDKGDNVAKEDVSSIVVESQNSYVGKLLSNGSEVTTLTKVQTNPMTFVLKTNQKSGLVPIKITANFVDANDVNRTLSQTINIIVYSGPATAMSISYVGVTQDAERAKYVESYAVTATDAYNNRVNTSPSIAAGAVVGYAVDGSAPSATETSTSKRLYFAKGDAQLGTITPVNGNQAEFSVPNDGQNRFQYVDQDNDKLVLFGEGYTYEALGKWDFIKSGDSNYTLELKDDYLGATRANLYYAVGHNYRQDPCRTDGTEYVGFASVSADTPNLDEEGTAIVEFKYDYHLTGKDIMLWVNLNGYQADTDTTTRIGESKKVTLRGNGFISKPTEGVTVTKNTSMTVTFDIWHADGVEQYKNGHFGWYPAAGSSCGYSVISSSNVELTDDGYRIRDTRECTNAGNVYLTLELTATETEDCSFNITDIAVVNEF